MSGDLEAGLYTYLTTDSNAQGVYDIVKKRIYPLVMPERVQLPAISYMKVTESHSEHLNGSAGLTVEWLQINAWADKDKFEEARELAEEVRMALQGYRGLMGSVDVRGVHQINEQSVYDDESENNRIILDFRFWHREPEPSFS